MKVNIVGAGPAGMFAADRLLEAGHEVVMYEMGRPMSERWCPQTTACACRSCFVIEGAGGAGGYSDGKLPLSLRRGTQGEDIFPESAGEWLSYVDDVVTGYAGPGKHFTDQEKHPIGDGLTLEHYPLRHVGTDGIRRWTKGMMADLVTRGLTVHYGARVTSVGKDRSIQYTSTDGDGSADCDALILSPGIQGLPWIRDVVEAWEAKMLPGPAGVGVRIETHHRILAPLFQMFYDWKITAEMETGLSLRSFCCNEQGYVTTQLHRQERVRGVNGHSYLHPKRKSEASNFALIAKIGSDWAGLYGDTPQEYVSRVATQVNGLSDVLGDGGHPAVQRLGDFMYGIPTRQDMLPDWATNAQGVGQGMARSGVSIHDAIELSLAEPMIRFIDSLEDGINTNLNDALVYAPELKYPAYRAPVSLETYAVKDLDGIYIAGDASGYVDSLVAAAITGILAAEDIVAGD